MHDDDDGDNVSGVIRTPYKLRRFSFSIPDV